jgi:DNA processing protein
MIEEVNFHISKLDSMKKYPKELYYIGDLHLLEKKMISIVGTRKPNNYTKLFTAQLSKKLSSSGIVVVSGAAMGVDAIAHQNAIPNTIAVVANGLDIHYPTINKNLITQIEKESLVLSTYPIKATAKTYTFVERNELVVALGDILIVTQADLGSGSLRSVEFALKMGKKIYTLPHRIGESEGTNNLLKKGLATAIYDIDGFLESLGVSKTIETEDEFLDFCKNNPSYDEVVSKYGSKVFEYELLGKIVIFNGIVKLG